MNPFRILLYLAVGMIGFGFSVARARPILEDDQSLTLLFDNVRTRDRDFQLLRSREGYAVTNPVDPYVLNLTSQLKLMNPIGVRLGDNPIIGRSFRISFARGSEELGYETKTRLMDFVQTMDNAGQMHGLVVMASRDTGGDSERTNVDLATSRTESVVSALREAGLSEEKIYLDNMFQLANSPALLSSDIDIVVVE